MCRAAEEEAADLTENINVDLEWLEDAAVTDAMIESLHEEYSYESDEDDEDCGHSDTITKCQEFLSDLEDAAEKDMGLGVARGNACAKALKILLVDKVITGTGEALHNMWSGGRGIHGAMQRQMKARVEKAKKKAELILIGIVKPALSNAKGGKAIIWARLKDSFIDICLSTLRSLVILMEKSPHPGGWGMQALQEHFQMKEFLADISSNVWSSVLYDTSTKVPADDIVPILRQLAMLDCVDQGWNWHGSWSEVLDALSNKCCGQIKRIAADDELERISFQIRKADNSMRCKLMACNREYGSFISGVDSAPQKWRYQLKCSAMNCSNIEDPENPHTLRCQECWYFHWCCEGCKTQSCDFSRQHDMCCTATPPEKAEQTKQEVFALLGWGEHASTGTAKACHSCGKKEGQGTTLNKCGRKYYCSALCEKWNEEHGGSD